MQDQGLWEEGLVKKVSKGEQSQPMRKEEDFEERNFRGKVPFLIHEIFSLLSDSSRIYTS